MTLSTQKSPSPALPSLETESQSVVSEEQMRQAVRTLLIGLGEDPDREAILLI